MFSDFVEDDNVIDIIDEYGISDISSGELKEYIERNIKNSTFINVLSLMSDLPFDEKVRVITSIEDPYYFEKALYNVLPMISRVFLNLLPTNDTDRLKILLRHIKEIAHEYQLSGKKIGSIMSTYRQYMMYMLIQLYTHGRIEDVENFIFEEHPSLSSIYPLLIIMDEKDVDEILGYYTNEDITELALDRVLGEDSNEEPSSYREFLPPGRQNAVLNEHKRRFEKFLPYLLIKGVDMRKIVRSLEDSGRSKKIAIVMRHYDQRLKEIEDYLYENYIAPREVASIIKEYIRD